MRSINIIAVGTIKEPYWREAQAEFQKRIAPYVALNIIEVAHEPITNTATKDHAMKKEAERIRARLPKKDAHIILMDREGKAMDSERFAASIETWTETGRPLVFIIGGSAGADESIRRMAETRITLSPMTFTHEMARIIVLEQLYRAETVLRGKAYHY